MCTDDAAPVLDIYQQGINTGYATFETAAPTWEKFDDKFLKHSRLVAVEDGIVRGWAVLAPTSPRECYRGVSEISIYIHEDHRGRGIGKLLMPKLIEQSEYNGSWTLQSLIHTENMASIHLHELFGFRVVGYRERISKLNGVWKTIVLMERRSHIVGND